MKKLFILIVALCSVTTLSAQVKGEKVVGGLLGVRATSILTDSGDTTTTVENVSFSIAPEFGYFVADRFKIGAKLAVEIESNTQTIQILPNIAYYIRLCEGLYYAPEFRFGFVAGISNNITMPGLTLGLSIGNFEFRPTKKFGMSVNLLSLDYMYMSYSGARSNGINFNLGVSPSVGMKYYF